MLEELANLQPILIVGLLIVMYSLEMGWPYLARPSDRTRHDGHNAILTIVAFVMNGALGFLVLASLAYTEAHHLGLLNYLSLPPLIAVPAGMLLYDLGSYALHNLQHHVPWLWRIHRVHHSDASLNTTSALRFHPLDVVLSQCLFPCLWIPVIGMSMTSFVIYGTLAILLLIPQHANVKCPDWFEASGRLVFSTPGWHKIHHADEVRLTNSHYGDVFTFWDRIFRTWHRVGPHEIRYGLRAFASPERQRVGFLLKSPFVDVESRDESGAQNA